MFCIRVTQLLLVGFCLFLISKSMQFMFAAARSFDRMMMRRFFDVEGLTDEIRLLAARRQDCSVPSRAAADALLLRNPLYRWLCNRLRRASGLGPLRRPESD